ncbi:MAG: Maf family protein [Treponema sp.]|jgi:septum formation protein|nr:Maf family protein [Treponema sp.]
METIILASSSPRRVEYFKLLGLPFVCVPSLADETLTTHMDGKAAAEELAVRKIRSVLARYENAAADTEKPLWICGADTVIEFEGKLYGKPLDRPDAQRMLKTLQGKTHHVISAVALYSARSGIIDSRPVSSLVTFALLTEGEIRWYLESGEWQDAAGAYKIQGLASCFISGIQGSYSSVVGLPLREFYVMLRDNGYPYGG